MAGPALLSMVLGVAMFGCDDHGESSTTGAMSTSDTDNGGENTTTGDPTDDAGGETYAGPGWKESTG